MSKKKEYESEPVNQLPPQNMPVQITLVLVAIENICRPGGRQFSFHPTAGTETGGMKPFIFAQTVILLQRDIR